MSRQRPRELQQGSRRWVRYHMKQWANEIGRGVPKGQRRSLRGKAREMYARPWWVETIQPYEGWNR